MAASTWWQRRRELHTLERRAIPDALWLHTLARYPLLQWRSAEQLTELRRLSTLLLAEKEFHGAHGFEITDDIAVAIVAQACLPVLHLGLTTYRSFVGIVVHEGEVLARREAVDDSGVVTFYDETLSGEAMEGGPLMLSWADVSQASRSPDDATAYNVVIHEFVHVLDLTDGEINGMPALPNVATRRHWRQVMEASLHRFCRHLDEGRNSVIDPYGAEGFEEFFPVAAEAFFACPARLREEDPHLYALLSDYFQQDPAQWSSGE